MGTKYPELFADLAAPFDASEVKNRQGQGGRNLSYITARTAMNRLDDVLGPENWSDEYSANQNSVLCRLTIVLPDGSKVTKCDAGGYAGMADQGDDDKSGYSDAFKRACAKFGLGRYLYRDGMPQYVREVLGINGNVPGPGARNREQAPVQRQRDREPQQSQPQREYREQPQPQSRERPQSGYDRARDEVQDDVRRDFRRDRDDSQAQYQDRPQPRQDAPAPRGDRDVPKTGKALYSWVKDMEARYEVALLKYLNGWGKMQEFPARMIEWNADEVALAHAEGLRKLAAGQAHPDDEAVA